MFIKYILSPTLLKVLEKCNTAIFLYFLNIDSCGVLLSNRRITSPNPSSQICISLPSKIEIISNFKI